MGKVYLMIILLALGFAQQQHLNLSFSTIKFLPGFEGPLPFELETGYIGVDESEDVQLFYYFVKSESNPGEHPLILWLTGGPGCSSFTGLAFEIEGIEASTEPVICLKGYLLGNPVTNPDVEYNYRIPFSHGMALISDELYESLMRNCRGEYYYVDSSNTRCLQDVNAFNELTSGFSLNQILDPICELASHKPNNFLNKRRYMHEKILQSIASEASPCPDIHTIGYQLSQVWLNDESVRKALYIREGTVAEWIRCNWDVPYIITDMNSYPYHVNLSTKGYRSLIYSGDHDFIVPFLATQAWIRSLNYSIVDDWRQWIVEGQVAGFTRSYSNRMTFATVKGGGHTAPEYNPRECFQMFKRWLLHQSL